MRSADNMTGLLDFPNEILCQVIDAVDVMDIEAFAALCKAVHLLAKEAMLKHRNHKRKYGEVRFGYYQDSDKKQPPICLLRDIIRDPTVALYPTAMDVGTLGYMFKCLLKMELGRAAELLVAEIADEYDNEIRQLLANCACIELVEIDEWCERVAELESGAVYGLLLTLLPNLRSINI